MSLKTLQVLRKKCSFHAEFHAEIDTAIRVVEQTYFQQYLYSLCKGDLHMAISYNTSQYQVRA